MARAGVGSRRACDRLVEQGRVTINGTLAQPGAQVDVEHDQIAVDGKPLRRAERMVYVAVYKPRGVLSAPDVADEERKWVRDIVPLPERLYPVGRLDADSEGLILLTNDGELANRLMHPRYEHEKTYRVLVDGVPSGRALEQWRTGVMLDGKLTAPAKVKVLSTGRGKAWLRIVMREGRKRQIRQVAGVLGLSVRRLLRLRIATIGLRRLRSGQWRELSPQEVRDLKRLVYEGPRTRQRR